MAEENQTPTTSAPYAMHRAGPIDASSLLCMVVREDRIELPGFGSPTFNAFAPGVRFVRISDTGNIDASAEIAVQSARTRAVIISSATMLATALLLGGILFSVLSAEDPAPAMVPMAWTVQDVWPNGVRVRSGAQEIFIPHGNRLPNGEVLIMTNPAQRTFTTPNGVTAITGSSQ